MAPSSLLTKSTIENHSSKLHNHKQSRTMSSTSSISTASSSVKSQIPRERYTSALAKSIELEKIGDKMSKLDKSEKAIREYQKSIQLEKVYLGQYHQMVSDYHDKLLEKEGSLKKISLRFASLALSKSLELEKEGDKLCVLGRIELAQRKYKKCYTIEKSILGDDHPMVSSLQQKMIICRAA
jgi:hypothetical protein